MQIVDDVRAVHAFNALGHARVERVLKGPLDGSRVDLVCAGGAEGAFLAPECLLVRHFASCHAAHVEPSAPRWSLYSLHEAV